MIRGVGLFGGAGLATLDKLLRIAVGFTELLVSTSAFLSLNAALVTIFSFQLYCVEVKPLVVLISFLATFSVYNMNRATDRSEDSVNRPDAATRNPMLTLAMSFSSLILCLALCAAVGAESIRVLGVSFLASIAYSVRVRPSVPRLKDVLGVKSIVVAFSWGFTGAFLPGAVYPVCLTEKLLVFSYVFIQLFVNTVLCDVRDVEGDRAVGIKTLPIALGLHRVRFLLLLVTSLLLPWLAYCKIYGFFTGYMGALVLGVAYSYMLVSVFTTGRRGRLVTDLAVDGEWIPILTFMKLL